MLPFGTCTHETYGHVSEGGPPTGWRCDIFPEKLTCQWCFQTEDDYIHYSLWSHFKAELFFFNLTQKVIISTNEN